MPYNQAFTDADVLHQELSENLDRPVEFYVYNTDADEVRVAVLMPTEVSKVWVMSCSQCCWREKIHSSLFLLFTINV